MPDMDPQMVQMMAQFGMTPFETTVAGDTKMVVMHMKLPAMDIPGQVDDWEIRGVPGMWSRGQADYLPAQPRAPRIEAASDAKFAKRMEEMNKSAAQAVQSLASGPWAGQDSAATAGATAMADAIYPQMQKKVHGSSTGNVWT